MARTEPRSVETTEWTSRPAKFLRLAGEHVGSSHRSRTPFDEGVVHAGPDHLIANGLAQAERRARDAVKAVLGARVRARVGRPSCAVPLLHERPGHRAVLLDAHGLADHRPR